MRRFLSILIVLCLVAAVCYADTQGNSAGSGADGGGGSTVWSAPNNITISGQKTTNTVTHGATSNPLLAETFNFSIPVGATVQGITVSYFKTSGVNCIDGPVQLIKGGVISGNDHSSGDPWIQDSTYGGPSDLWGVALAPADVNAANFGVAISAVNTDGSINRSAAVNAFVSITVTFSGGGSMGRRGPIQYSQTRTTGGIHAGH